jgi:thiamine-phosphate pyrophosphorylase
MRAPLCRLYLITPPALDPVAFSRDLLAVLEAGDVACLQLRLPGADDEAIQRAADAIRPVTRKRDVALIMGGRPDLARATGCDGVHVGPVGQVGLGEQEYTAARRSLGDQAIVGVSAGGSRHLAMTAAESGADYVSFGAFFPSTTIDAPDFVTPEIIAWWSELMEIPCVAVGGITADNCAPLVEAGADFIAVCGGVWRHPEGPAAALRAFARALAG